MSIAKKSIIALAAVLITSGFLAPGFAWADQASQKAASTTKAQSTTTPPPIKFVTFTLTQALIP
ncbi:MAG: hypothetical protein WBE92_17360 [Steroidobacteraceae bacterium]